MAVYLILYAASFLFARISHYALSGIVLIFAALVLAYHDLKGMVPYGRLRGLFSLGFVGGQGVSALKLSALQTDWLPETWAALFVAYTVFWLVFEILRRRSGGENHHIGRKVLPYASHRMFLAVIIITVLSAAAFLLEVKLVGYVPFLLRGVPHAYSYFHVSGVHYFTVSCVMVPSFAALWMKTARQKTHLEEKIVMVCSAIAFLIPILCVSRFQLILSASLLFLTLVLSAERRPSPFAVIILVLALLPVYVILTIARSHSVEYLNGIFEMKVRLPIFISQPYIYIANNYDNLNCLIGQLTRHTFGLRMLFPVWGLTGLKFLFPQLVSFPLYVTKEELTTVTLFYDAWYDFGIIGIAFLSGILGFVSYKLECWLEGSHHPAAVVFYAQFAVYLGLAFFTTWFSNPATWFYFAETLAVLLFTGGHDRPSGSNLSLRRHIFLMKRRKIQ